MLNLSCAGTVGRQPELRSTQSGDKILSFSIAVDMGKKMVRNLIQFGLIALFLVLEQSLYNLG